ncbi:MAG: LysR family transcriptional regulator [Lachnospiraceae bacterium]|jgi:DNA-binding transcriptional LysR family regulator
MDRNIQKYEALAAAAEEGNITKAAQKLSFAQSSVSKMIADLESEWHIRLLNRSRDGVTLTEEGKMLMPGIRALLDACGRLDEKVGQIRGMECGNIRIGVFSSVAEHWMPGIISAFHKDHPGIRYELLTGDYDEIEAWLAEERIDAGFLRLPARHPFDTVKITDDPYMAVLPKDHPLCSKQAIEPADLNGQPFLALEHGGKTDVSEFLEKYDITPDIRFSTWDDYSIMAMVEIGQGVALLPELILQRIPYEIEIRPMTVDCRRTIGIAVPDRHAMSSALEEFLKYVIREVSEKAGK